MDKLRQNTSRRPHVSRPSPHAQTFASVMAATWYRVERAWGVELQEVSPAPLRTVSGRASRLRAPGDGVGNPQQRIAMCGHVVVTESGRLLAQFTDEHLPIQMVAALARFDNQPGDVAVE